jgi:hypothetical protein
MAHRISRSICLNVQAKAFVLARENSQTNNPRKPVATSLSDVAPEAHADACLEDLPDDSPARIDLSASLASSLPQPPPVPSGPAPASSALERRRDTMRRRVSLSECECPICLDVFFEPVRTPCGHVFCRGCLREHQSYAARAKCPICRGSLEGFPLFRAEEAAECALMCQRLFPEQLEVDRSSSLLILRLPA